MHPGANQGYEWGGYAGGQEALIHGVGGRSSNQAVSTRPATAQPLRVKISERLQQIDREAFENEERRYQQRGEEIQNEITLILRGTHPVFMEGVARLAAERDRGLASAEQAHQYLVELYEKAYKQEREAVEAAYAADKQLVYDKIAADIEERRKRLKEEKESQDVSSDFVFESGSRTSSKRNLRKRGMDPLLGLVGESLSTGSGRGQNKRKNNQTASMQGITEDEIVSDLVAIRKATGVTGPLTNNIGGKKSTKGGKR
ncbi:hypothetical protein GGI07_001010 [Coemansia sp. Benny D115]|nr:hypothetical protein GGI07_001010 [Coemansia sp. Benny D115]